MRNKINLQPTSYNLQASKGFMLMEIVVGLFIIAVVLLIYNAALNTVVLNKNSQQQDLALRIASTEMEYVRSLAYASLPSSGSFASSQLASLPSGAGSLTVSSYNAKTKQIVVTVSWRQAGGSTDHTVSLTTLITDQGGL